MKPLLRCVIHGWVAVFLCISSSYAQPDLARRETISPVVKLPTVTDFDVPIPGPGLKMKRTGTTLTVAGAVLLIGGVVLVSTADDVYYSQTTNQYGTYQEGDPKGALGAVMLVSGAGMTVTGIILWSKGARKYRRHLEMQENAKLVAAAGNRGLSIGFRF